MVACILLLLLREAAGLLGATRCVSSGRLLLTIRSALISAATSTDSLRGLTGGLVRHLMVVHAHQLVDQVAELSRVAVDLVPSSAAHRRLLIFELLL